MKLNRKQIEMLFDFDLARQHIQSALVADAGGHVQNATVGHLGFPNARGDVHIKSGHIAGSEHYVVKIASSFFGNPDIGLSSSNGMMIAFSAQDGTISAILHDEGWLTDMRTAICGAMVSLHLARRDARSVLIIGSGIQAELQARCLNMTEPDRRFSFAIWGRSSERAENLSRSLSASGIDAKPALELGPAIGAADIVITTTPSRAPLFSGSDVLPGTHITAVGADTPGKQELPLELVECANLRVCDSREQALDHGEFQHAAKADSALSVVEYGYVISGAHPGRADATSITVADLTGTAAQDIAIAQTVIDAARTNQKLGKNHGT